MEKETAEFSPNTGGGALGFDRLVAILTNRPGIRDIAAFPDAKRPGLDGAVAPAVAEKQLKDLFISTNLPE